MRSIDIILIIFTSIFMGISYPILIYSMLNTIINYHWFYLLLTLTTFNWINYSFVSFIYINCFALFTNYLLNMDKYNNHINNIATYTEDSYVSDAKNVVDSYLNNIKKNDIYRYIFKKYIILDIYANYIILNINKYIPKILRESVNNYYQKSKQYLQIYRFMINQFTRKKSNDEINELLNKLITKYKKN